VLVYVDFFVSWGVWSNGVGGDSAVGGLWELEVWCLVWRFLQVERAVISNRAILAPGFSIIYSEKSTLFEESYSHLPTLFASREHHALALSLMSTHKPNHTHHSTPILHACYQLNENIPLRYPTLSSN